MAKVTDIQDKNGATREIQDKDLANRTSQSSIASSDYVLLEDTNGAYHKIAKASFTEAVRGALGSVINSVAKGTDIAKVPVLDSNNDLGMGTLSNLASVLGGQFKTIDSPDLNNLKESGVYKITGTPTNIPSDVTILANVPSIAVVQHTDKGGFMYVAFCAGNTQYMRIMDTGNGNWYPWSQITTDFPSFYKSYTDLSSLASALGVGHKDRITLNGGGEFEIPNTAQCFLVGIQSNSELDWSFGVYANGTTSQPFVTATYSAIGNQNGKICIVRKVENQNLFIVNNTGSKSACGYFYMQIS